MARGLTKQRFIEYNPEGKESLKEWRDLFVACEDPTEYEFAQKVFPEDGWAGWERFKQDWPYFKNKILATWHDELDVAMRSKAVRGLTKREDTNALKWLAEGKYKPESYKKKGGKGKLQEEQIKKKVAEEVDEDVARVLDSNVVKFDRN